MKNRVLKTGSHSGTRTTRNDPRKRNSPLIANPGRAALYLEDAARRLDPHIDKTPILRSRVLDEITGGSVFLKCEIFQRTGSFKIRGALNRMIRIDPDVLRRGVVADSSGNHGIAVSFAAKTLGTSALVAIPDDAVSGKVETIKDLGAEIVRYNRQNEEGVDVARRLAHERGATFVHSHDHWDLITGQGTLALELLAQCDELDLIVASTSGGSLLAGTYLANRAKGNPARVVGAQPRTSDAMSRSLAAGRRVKIGPQTRLLTRYDCGFPVFEHLISYAAFLVQWLQSRKKNCRPRYGLLSKNSNS